MLFEGAIFRGDDLLIGGELVYVFADPATQTSKPVPPRLREILTGYEANEDMLTVRVGGWDTLGGDAQRVRTEVFVREQRIPAQLEWDEADSRALHAVAYNRLGQPLATGRLLAQAPGVGRIGRMAVDRRLRGTGFGRRALDALERAAAQRGEREILLHAQCSAEGFYARSGYRVRGTPFDEAGIAHIEMHKAL
jgi:predicted GNAT family N-acyltransferase